jgi:hypothetical protein
MPSLSQVFWSGIENRSFKMGSALCVLYDRNQGISGVFRPLEYTDLQYVGRVTSGSAIRTTNNVPFPGNIRRKELYVQSLSTGAMYINLTNGNVASPTGFNAVLKAGTAEDDGNGAIFRSETVTGVVNVSGAIPPLFNLGSFLIIIFFWYFFL